MPDDKFIFVNAPTIINAGPRDARRQLRSQLMRRVYLKKYKVSPSAVEDDGINVTERDSSSSPEQCHCSHPSASSGLSPPDDTHHERNKGGKKTKNGKSRIPPQSKLPTPPIDDDEVQEVCESCGGVCHDLKQGPSKGRTESPPKERMQEDGQIIKGDSDPKMTLGASLINPFEEKFSNKKECPNSNALIQHFTQVLIPMLRSGHDYSQNVFTEYNALRELRRAVASPKISNPKFDGILLSICLIAVSDPMGELPPSINKMDYNPFHHVLQPLGGLNIYGYQPRGFDQIQLFGAKWKIAYTSLKYAIHTCTKPVFPICNHYGALLINQEPLNILGLTPSDLSPLTGTGFSNLDMFSIRESIQQVFVEISQVAQGMNMLMPQRDNRAVRDSMADARNLVQYRFQNLPTLADDPSLIVDLSLFEGSKQATAYAMSIMEVASSVYGMCWLVTYLFTTHVTFPVPSSRRFRLKTVYQIRDAISNCGYALQHNSWVLKLQLWSVIIAGIAAEDIDAELRQWMALRARDLCTMLCLQRWDEVVDVMTSFAWMEAACAHGARKFWAQVQSNDG
ncbi:hypothetical protein TCE0_024r07363 [Talaromyces pinophilus]|uniref:Uncharacterized protein n=1 Tax=Talaromyces pinophilus TaxID=128442 RepID=A0A6V8H8W1_TALPI|nr:hypothetical protein TCE0_024r07363 [Talaromyces pinophilus]